MIFTLNTRVTTWVITTLDLVLGFKNNKQLLAIDVIITPKVGVNQDGLSVCLKQGQGKERREQFHRPLDDQVHMGLVLYPRYFNLARVEDFDMKLLELVVHKEPIDKDETIVKGTLFSLLVNTDQVLATHPNVNLTHVIEDHSPGRIVNLVKYFHYLEIRHLFVLTLKLGDFFFVLEIELYLLLDNAFLIVVIGNHG
jgi:hypothetical protein